MADLMADLNEAIERFLSRSEPAFGTEAERRLADDLLIARAARSWAALRWKPGTERPETSGVREVRVWNSRVRRLWFFDRDRRHCTDREGMPVKHDQFWWLDGSLPDVPGGSSV